MRKKKQNTVGIYLWKLVLVIVAIFTIFVSVECFFLIERTVKNWVSGTSEEHNSSTATDSNLEKPEENKDTNANSENETSTPEINNELNNIANEPDVDDAGSISVASVSEEVVCTESHTHKSVCYETNISQEDRMVIYNLVNTISNLGTYSSKLSSLKNYISYYNSYTTSSSTTYYNSYYKNYLYSWYEKAVEANTIMTQQVSSTYYNYITNRDQLLELLNLKTLIDAFEALDTLPLRYDFLTKINGFKNSSDTEGMINYLTEVSNIYTTTYPRFTALGIDSSMYQYVINYNHLLELQKISNNLSKITSVNNALKSLPKWSDVTTNLNNYKTNNVDQYMSYLTDLTNKVNTVVPNYTNQNLDTTLNTYVVNYDSYQQLVNIPKILECAKLLKDLPKWDDVTTKLNDYKTNNVDQYINYLTELTNMINTIIPNYTNQNLASTYTTYVINYNDYTKLTNIPKILECAKILKDLIKYDEVRNKINEFKSANNVDGVIEYLKPIATIVEEKDKLFTSQNLSSTYTSYVINYSDFTNLKRLYLSDVVKYTEQIKPFSTIDDLLQIAKDFKEKNQISEYIQYIEEWEESNRDNINNIYSQIGKQTGLNNQYIINYQKLYDLYQTNFEKIIDLVKKIEEISADGALDLAAYKIRTQIAVLMQSYQNISKENTHNAEFIINYEKLKDMQDIFADSDTDIKFTIQHYANLDVMATSGTNALTLIDTTGKTMPKNKGNDSTLPTGKSKKMYVDSTGKVQKTNTLTEIYSSVNYNFSAYFDDLLVKNVLKFTSFYDVLNKRYNLKEVWVLSAGKKPTSTARGDWKIYTYNDELCFTRNENNSNSNTIYISDGAVIRYVYDTVEKEIDINTAFYDYDISTGWIFRTNIKNITDVSNYYHVFAGDVFDGNTIKQSFLTWAQGNSRLG